MSEIVTDHGFSPGRLIVDPKTGRLGEFVVVPDISSILINGPPGSGKTSLAIWNAVHLQRCIVAEDSKGELSAILGRLMQQKTHGGFGSINPYGLHVSTHQHMRDIKWNGCRDIRRKGLDFAEDCQSTLVALNDRHGISDANSYFDNSATEAGVAVLQDMLANDPDASPADWRNAIAEPYAVNAATGEPVGLLKRFFCLAGNPDPSIANKAARFTTGARSNAEVIATLIQISGFIDFPAIRRSMEGPGINWAALKNSAQMLSLVIPADKLATLKSYRRLFWQTAIRELIRAPSTGQFPPAMLLIDEAPQLGKLQALLTAVAVGRGYGIRPIIITQDLSQISDIYGEKGFETFVSTATCLCSFAPNNFWTADFLSKMCGNKIVVSRSASKKSGAQDGINLSDSYHDRRLFEPYQLMQMPPGQMLVLIQGMPPFFTKVENYWESHFADRLDSNPYHPPKKARR
jgi:type IV secretory pathway TraG/TraD family ATPase VirD4